MARGQKITSVIKENYGYDQSMDQHAPAFVCLVGFGDRHGHHSALFGAGCGVGNPAMVLAVGHYHAGGRSLYLDY